MPKLNTADAHDWIARNYGAHWFLPEHDGGDPEWVDAMTQVLVDKGTEYFGSQY
jgi:hypothetical protein